ncbi:hypothetical protein EDB81DRAFT_179032 [Dactylonectria macrodidyma]|uniref:Uncharacterized protein n=1 Tax=Dactylonectria macrodidyma TaxID=307937 RepID=A0A9P9FNS3_9HYPO|nr:hypothetical protein EDB81DRAFT_179032 [Dactylonectria macrodidyma]
MQGARHLSVHQPSTCGDSSPPQHALLLGSNYFLSSTCQFPTCFISWFRRFSSVYAPPRTPTLPSRSKKSGTTIFFANNHEIAPCHLLLGRECPCPSCLASFSSNATPICFSPRRSRPPLMYEVLTIHCTAAHSFPLLSSLLLSLPTGQTARARMYNASRLQYGLHPGDASCGSQKQVFCASPPSVGRSLRSMMDGVCLSWQAGNPSSGTKISPKFVTLRQTTGASRQCTWNWQLGTWG